MLVKKKKKNIEVNTLINPDFFRRFANGKKKNISELIQ